MADDNIPEKKKKGRPATPAVASAPAYSKKPEKASESSSQNYNAQSYGIFKMRLNNQTTEIKRMSDYSEDSAIRLNDIYEILKGMRPVPYVSSLDTYFYENGYIPVKVINPCCDEESIKQNADDNKNDEKKPKGFKEYVTELVPAAAGILAYFASQIQPVEETVAAPVDAISMPVIDPRVEAVRVSQMPAAAKQTVVIDQNPTPTIVNTPTTDSASGGSLPLVSTPSPSTVTATTQSLVRPGLPVTPLQTNTRTTTGTRAVSTGGTAFKQLNDIAKNPTGSRITPNIPNLGMPGQGGLGGGGVPGIFGDDEDGLVYDDVSYKQKSSDALGNYGITKDNTDNTILTARKINFVAKEITYEAGKFEFIDQNGAPSADSYGSYGGGMGSDLSNVAFNPQDYVTPNYGSGGSDSYQLPSTHENFTAKESAVIDMISRRESAPGDEGYNMILGDKRGRPGTSPLGVPPKPITEMTLNELYDWQTQMLRHPRNAQLYGEPSSAVGKGQFVRTTLFGKNRSGGLLAQMGITPDMWGYVKFDKTLQDMLILQNFKDNVGDPNADPSTWSMRGLGNQWEAFKYKPLDQNDINSLRGVRSADTSNELGPHADIASKSASTTKELNTPPAKSNSTSAPAIASPSAINISSPLPAGDEPWAAFIDMFDMLDDATSMKNPWI